jgi:hypothetical protein
MRGEKIAGGLFGHGDEKADRPDHGTLEPFGLCNVLCRRRTQPRRRCCNAASVILPGAEAVFIGSKKTAAGLRKSATALTWGGDGFAGGYGAGSYPRGSRALRVDSPWFMADL